MNATSIAPARRDWTTVGQRFAAYRGRFEEAVEALTWCSPPPADLPAMQGIAIRTAVAELALPKVTAVAFDAEFEMPDGDSGGTAYLSVLGIECNYKDAKVRAYVVDTGSELVPTAMDVWPKGVA